MGALIVLGGFALAGLATAIFIRLFVVDRAARKIAKATWLAMRP